MKKSEDEFLDVSPVFSYPDIEEALDYAIEGIVVEPSEVGVEVYGELFHEKVFEYLSEKFEVNGTN